MSTIKETQEKTVKAQLNLAVRDLIKYMNSASELNIAIVEEETKDSWFEFLLEYPPYEDNRQKFQRRVSNLETDEFISNVFSNIEDFMGCEYNQDNNFVKAFVPPDRYDHQAGFFSIYGRLCFFKKIHISIGFVENR